ncbi:MAG: lmo0937 family membrane protein [Longimicrobiales bacterium]
MNMLLWIGIILIILWLLGFTTFQVAGGLIHILLIAAIVVLILYFVRGRAPRV